MIVRTGLNPEKHKKIGELSKGYSAFGAGHDSRSADPDSDEPTSGLDPNQIVEILILSEIGEEKTVVLSTHILPEVEATQSHPDHQQGKSWQMGQQPASEPRLRQELKVRLEDT